MTNSAILYKSACNFAQTKDFIPAQYYIKNYYLQIVTTMFYELVTEKNSPILSKFCADNSITINAKNFKITAVPPTIFKINFADIYLLSYGLCTLFEKNLDACAKSYDEGALQKYIFCGTTLTDEYVQKFLMYWKNIDKHLGNGFRNDDENDLLQSLNYIAQNRKSDDEKIIDEIKKVQTSMQDEIFLIQQSLKKISAIQDETEFRGVKESINQLIQLYRKLDENLKRHPMTDTQKGYAELIKRCNKMLNYIVQSLKMLGVEVIDETGGTFNPDRNKVADDSVEPLDSVVTKIVKVGFSYKGVDVIEKAEVEVAEEKIL